MGKKRALTPEMEQLDLAHQELRQGLNRRQALEAKGEVVPEYVTQMIVDGQTAVREAIAAVKATGSS